MKLGVGGQINDETFAFGRQIGATDFVGGDARPLSLKKGYLVFQDLMLMRNQIEDAGLKWTATNVPEEWTDKIKLGLPGRDDQITSWCKSIENMGAVGIPAIIYFFSLRSGFGHYGLRTSRTTPGRGSAKVTSYDHDLIQGAKMDFWDTSVEPSAEVTDQQVWDNVTYFLERVIPIAEEAGVKLAVHPDDPPLSPIGGVARVLRSHAALKRLIEIVPSDSNCLTFCQGTISEMPENVFDAIRYFGSRNKVCLVHFRNVTGPVPKFSETFIDEGHVDMVKAMRTWHEVGYDGPMVEDHVPHMVGGGKGRQYQSTAFALGYMKGLMHAVGGR